MFKKYSILEQTLNQTSLAEVTKKLVALEDRLKKYRVEDTVDVLTVLGKTVEFGESIDLFDKSKVFVGEVYTEKVKIIQKAGSLGSLIFNNHIFAPMLNG